MANTIEKFKKYIDTLDEVYKVASVTSVLDGNNRLVKMGANANEIVIPKMSMDGLADYSRENGYVGGDVTLTNETVTFNYERGRSFNIDAMDNEENELEVRCVAVALSDAYGAYRYAVSVSAPKNRMTDQKVEIISKKLLTLIER